MKLDYEMQQHPVNERISFLLKSFRLSARAFSETIGEKPTITQNYVGSRNSMPGADYLEKVLKRFDSINPAWLLVGEGEPFKEGSIATPKQENNLGEQQVAVTSGPGKTMRNTYTLPDCEKERDTIRVERDQARQEIVRLQTQLITTKDALIASKEETIDVLKAANRPG